MKRLGHSLLIAIAVLVLALPVISAGQQTLLLDIKGMHCSGCASGIEAMLKRVDGVTKVDVSYERHEARVEYDPARTGSDRIIEAVEKMGYKAALKQ